MLWVWYARASRASLAMELHSPEATLCLSHVNRRDPIRSDSSDLHPYEAVRSRLLSPGEPRRTAVGICYHPGAGRQQPRADELGTIGGGVAPHDDGDPHQQRE